MEDYHARNATAWVDDLANAMNAVMVAAREAAEQVPRVDLPAVPQNIYPTSAPSWQRGNRGNSHGKVKRNIRGR